TLSLFDEESRQRGRFLFRGVGRCGLWIANPTGFVPVRATGDREKTSSTRWSAARKAALESDRAGTAIVFCYSDRRCCVEARRERSIDGNVRRRTDRQFV